MTEQRVSVEAFLDGMWPRDQRNHWVTEFNKKLETIGLIDKYGNITETGDLVGYHQFDGSRGPSKGVRRWDKELLTAIWSNEQGLLAGRVYILEKRVEEQSATIDQLLRGLRDIETSR